MPKCIKRESRVFDEACPSNLQKNMQIGSDGHESSLQLTLFPNPTDGYLFVQSNKVDAQNGHCTILGIDGREVYSGTIDFQKGLSLKNLSMTNGVYIMEITAKNEIFYKQFVYIK